MYVKSSDPIPSDPQSAQGTQVKEPFTVVVSSTGRVRSEDVFIAEYITSESCG